jgi:hypothetical protein
MYLDAANKVREIVSYSIVDSGEAVKAKPVFEKWRHFPVSKFSRHDADCCKIARQWLLAMDFSQLNGGSVLTGPRWIRQRYDWGPTKWRIYWCEAVERKSLDCGAQAALASEVFKMRGVKSYPVQLVQQYSNEATSQWSKKWNGEDTSIHWINDDLIYHEGCAVSVCENDLKLWDASAGCWLNPQTFSGYGSLRAVRLFAARKTPAYFNWGNHRIIPNQWQNIEQKQMEFTSI